MSHFKKNYIYHKYSISNLNINHAPQNNIITLKIASFKAANSCPMGGTDTELNQSSKTIMSKSARFIQRFLDAEGSMESSL